MIFEWILSQNGIIVIEKTVVEGQKKMVEVWAYYAILLPDSFAIVLTLRILENVRIVLTHILQIN